MNFRTFYFWLVSTHTYTHRRTDIYIYIYFSGDHLIFIRIVFEYFTWIAKQSIANLVDCIRLFTLDNPSFNERNVCRWVLSLPFSLIRERERERVIGRLQAFHRMQLPFHRVKYTYIYIYMHICDLEREFLLPSFLRRHTDAIPSRFNPSLCIPLTV